MAPLCLAYYCSGHGYGHATRVSAFACHLLSIENEDKPTVYIISSAPKHVFAESIARGAVYRYAEIDPVIVQPLAYRVDRQKSVDALKLFLSKKDVILEVERQWLIDVKAQTVLSDAAFLGCLAAKAAGIPSVLITNFTFDSVYSYLSAPILDVLSPQQPGYLGPGLQSSRSGFDNLVPDIPIPPSDLEPLVEQIHAGYRCADILFLLPGYIPIPSFSVYPALPSRDWVDAYSNKLCTEITKHLAQPPSSYVLCPSVPFPLSSASLPKKSIPRSIVDAPLIVRPPTSSPSIYTTEGRSRFLSSIGIPIEYHDPARTKILVVSFGGQIFHTPSRSESRSRSPIWSHSRSPDLSPSGINGLGISDSIPELHLPSQVQHPALSQIYAPTPVSSDTLSTTGYQLGDADPSPAVPPRLATPSHIWIPGAPPASKPPSMTTPPVLQIPILTAAPPTPNGTSYFNLRADNIPEEEEPQLLPDTSWIAIVCGVSKEQQVEDQDTGLPDEFFIAPRDVYMPDLTAIGDVLLGKLGYGTVSECVDSCTPFVYVSRPLFIEEHGLRLFLNREGVGVELSRQSYEAGEWAVAVEEAWTRGKGRKAKKRAEMAAGADTEGRETEGKKMARRVLDWAKDWWDFDPVIGGRNE